MGPRVRLVATATVILAVGLGLVLVGSRRPEASSNLSRRRKIDRLYLRYKRSFAEVPEITVEQLLAARKTQPLVLVDVRSRREREVSMIPGAISAEQLERNLQAYADRRIVTYCTIGYRSGLYARELRRRGLDAVNLAGSILSWVHAGQPVVDEGGPTRRVHVYGPEWNLLPAGYVPVW